MAESSDLSTFWSAWIIIITLGSIFGCAWLLWITRKSQKFDSETEETMGHAFDGISEYDNPMPKWWLWMFMATMVFGLIYLVLYPGLGSFKGLLGWTQINQWEREVATANEEYAPVFEKFAAMSPDELMNDEDAMKVGGRLFANNCSVCHGSAARGGYGFPNLTDDDWLYGGTHEQISETLTRGRQGAMPAWQQILGSTGIQQATHYVRKMAGQENFDSDKAEAGQKLFASNCAACHGQDGKGLQALGAPNLTDGIWLYGGTQSAIEMSLRHGRNGVMPAFEQTLGPEKIHLMAAYVMQLSREQ